MINNILSTIIKFFFKILKLISNIILSPLTLIINNAFPDLSSYLSTANSFLNNYLFKGLSFAREIFYNLTGFPSALIGIMVTCILTFYSIKIGFRLFSFITNMWRFFRKGE